MIFEGKNIFNASFDAYAGDYHAVRPGYPDRLFADLKEQCKITEKSQLLEIGAGSGISTKELAKLGGMVVAVEPGGNLAEIARKQTASFGNVRIVESMFEDFHSDFKFDVVLAFTAFHWINEAAKYQKVADVLQDDGSLVLVWNSFFQADTLVTAEVNQIYGECLPEVYGASESAEKVNRGVLSKLRRREQEVCSSELFCTTFLEKYLTEYRYDRETYPKLLNTFPKIVEVDEARRAVFFNRIAAVVERHGSISVPILTTLIICKKRNAFLAMMGEKEKV